MHAGDDVAVGRLRRARRARCPRCASRSAPGRRQRVPGRRGQRGRVRARGPAPVQAAQQGRRRRPGDLPGPRARGSRSACAGPGTRGGTGPRPGSSSTPTTCWPSSPTTCSTTATSTPPCAGCCSRGSATATTSGSPACATCSRSCKRRRRDELERYDLGGVYEDIAERLREVVDTERDGIDQLPAGGPGVRRPAPAGDRRPGRGRAAHAARPAAARPGRHGPASCRTTSGCPTRPASSSSS